MKCIICDSENTAKSIEHIVPESFGNKQYIMKRGTICDNCNSRFSKFEGKALSNSIFAVERARFAIPTKKGKNVKGKIGKFKVKGDEEFRKQHITLEGLEKEDLKNYDPEKETHQIRIESFDKSEVATSRFLLMLGIESIYKSKNRLYEKYDFTELKNYLINKSNKDWGFITNQKNPLIFISIPQGRLLKYLKGINCELKFNNEYEDELLFHFKYGGVGMTINLLNRELKWVDDYKEKYKEIIIFPQHLDKKYNKSLEKTVTNTKDCKIES